MVSSRTYLVLERLGGRIASSEHKNGSFQYVKSQESVSEKPSVNEHGTSDLRHIKDCRWRQAS